MALTVATVPLPGAARAEDRVAEAQAVADTARCRLDLELPGFDKCETWAVQHAGSTIAPDDALDVAVGPLDGTVFVTGLMEDAITAVETTAHDPETGELLWSALTEGGTGSSVGLGVEVSPDGARVFVAGWTNDFGKMFDYLVQALDARTGELLWTSRYDGPGEGLELFGDMIVNGSSVIVTGQSVGVNGDYDAATVALDGMTGERLWEARFDGEAHADDTAEALTASVDGSLVFVVGSTGLSGPVQSEYLTIAYDASTGEEIWVSGFRGPNQRDGADAVVATADAVFVAGTIPDHGGLEYGTVAYEIEEGDLLWSARYVGAEGGWTIPNAIVAAPDGSRVFVTGTSANAVTFDDTAFDYATVTYDAGTGSQVWAVRYDGPNEGKDEAFGAVVTPDGSSIIVTGVSDTGPAELAPNGPWWDIATIAYDASNGSQRWLARYNGPMQQGDDGKALALSPSGDAVYVTGSGQGVMGTDFQTVAYSLT